MEVPLLAYYEITEQHVYILDETIHTIRKTTFIEECNELVRIIKNATNLLIVSQEADLKVANRFKPKIKELLEAVDGIEKKLQQKFKKQVLGNEEADALQAAITHAKESLRVIKV